MRRQLFKQATCIAWAAVAVSAAADANAKAATWQSGSHAVVSNHYYYSLSSCGSYIFNYHQLIKFTGAGCNSGSCTGGDLTVLVDSVYSSGRKHATYAGSCLYNNIYELGSCAC